MEEGQEKLPQTRQFWVWLTVFGSLFATGLFIIFQSVGWGIFDSVVGLAGLIVLIRDRLTNSLSRIPFRIPMLILVSIAISISVGYTVSEIAATQDAVRTYVLPRHITATQANELRKYLAGNEPHAVAVKVNLHDSEALQYAGQIFNALKLTNWNVDFLPSDTSDGMPNTLNDGLCIEGVPETNLGPSDRKHDAWKLMQQALQAAQIDSNCGGNVVAGSYRLFLCVGHRPQKVGDQRTVLFKLGQWIMQLSQRLQENST